MTLLEKLFNGDLGYSNLEEIFMILAICKSFDFSFLNNLDFGCNGRSQKASQCAVKPTQKKWGRPTFSKWGYPTLENCAKRETDPLLNLARYDAKQPIFWSG